MTKTLEQLVAEKRHLGSSFELPDVPGVPLEHLLAGAKPFKPASAPKASARPAASQRSQAKAPNPGRAAYEAQQQAEAEARGRATMQVIADAAASLALAKSKTWADAQPRMSLADRARQASGKR